MKENIDLQKENRIYVPTDILTIIGISAFVWVLHSLIHELLGHGVATFIMGEKITFLSTQWCMHTEITSVWGKKLVLAAGPLANLGIVLLSVLLLRSKRINTPSVVLFLWLLMVTNIFSFGSYMAGWFISPTFDWIKFIAGFEPIWLWKTIITLTGSAFIIIGIHLSTKYWFQLIGTDPKVRKRRITQITLIPWITFILVSLSGIILFRSDFPRAMMISGAFGVAGIFNIWMLLLRFWPFNKKDTEPTKAIAIERSYTWIIIGLASIIFYTFIMGPGINFAN